MPKACYLTPEQQSAYVRAWKKNGPLLEELRYDEARRMSDAQKWAAVEAVQGFAELYPSPRPPAIEPEEHGLVEQQRWFRRLHPPA
jgi:hypothetical protein